MQRLRITLDHQFGHRLVKSQRSPQVAVKHALPIVDILFANRNIEAICMPRRLKIGCGCAFSEHLLDGIAGNEMDHQEDNRNDKPQHGNGVEQAD